MHQDQNILGLEQVDNVIRMPQDQNELGVECIRIRMHYDQNSLVIGLECIRIRMRQDQNALGLEQVDNRIRMHATWILVIRQTLTRQTLQTSLTAIVRKFSCYTRVVNISRVEQSQEPDGLRSSHSGNPSLHLLLNRTFHCRIHKSWLLNQIPTQHDSVSIFIHSFRKIHFNIILLFTP